MTTTKLTHTGAVAIRTAVQTVASGGFLAAGNAALNSFGRYLPAGWLAGIGVALTWAVSTAHNALEDHGMVGTWLRQPTLTLAAIDKNTKAAAAATQKALAKAAAQAVKLAPEAQPLIDAAVSPLEAKIDLALAQLGQLVAAGLIPPPAGGQLVAGGLIPPPAAASAGPVVSGAAVPPAPSVPVAVPVGNTQTP